MKVPNSFGREEDRKNIVYIGCCIGLLLYVKIYSVLLVLFSFYIDLLVVLVDNFKDR